MRLVYGLAGVLLALGIVLYQPPVAVSNSSGSQPLFNGSPVTIDQGGALCTACHSSFEPNEGTGSVTIDAPSTFMPGETITFTVTVDNTTPPVGTLKQGFQVSVEDDAAVEHAGTLVIVDDENTRFSSGEQKYVTHTTAGNAQTTWTVGWTAPTDAPETVTIYAAGNAANGNFAPTGDYIYTTSATLSRSGVSNEEEATPLVARVEAIYPNPFVRAATVELTLERATPVTVTLYDGLGRAIRILEEGTIGAGAHTVRVERDGLAAGVYFIEVRTPEAVTTRPITLAR
jgi:hypothetical protein